MKKPETGWLAQMTRIMKLDEQVQGQEFEDLLNGRTPRYPKEFRSWSSAKKAAWLDEHAPLGEGR